LKSSWPQDSAAEVAPTFKSTKSSKAIDPQDEEGTGDDLEHVPLESDDHYDIDVAEDSSMDEANQ